MSVSPSSPRIGIYGVDEVTQEKRGCALWPAGYAAAVTEAGGEPVPLNLPRDGSSWEEAVEGLDGVLFLGGLGSAAWRSAAEERLCLWCQEHGVPVLGVDHGLHALNTTF